MTQKNSSKIISVVHPICCGWDVHKDMISACIIIKDKSVKIKSKYLGFSFVPLDLIYFLALETSQSQ